jgi:hypothetical protein
MVAMQLSSWACGVLQSFHRLGSRQVEWNGRLLKGQVLLQRQRGKTGEGLNVPLTLAIASKQ